MAFLVLLYDIIIKTFKKVDTNAKKVSIAIIVILIVIIGGLWFSQNKKNTETKKDSSNLITASTTDLGFDLETYAQGRANLEKIVIDKLIASTTSNVSADLPVVKTTAYSVNKIISSNDLSSNNLKTYGQKIADALAKYNTEQIDELNTALEALEEKNPIKAQSLLNLANSNKQIIADLLKISVPKTAITVHLNLINNLNQNTLLLNDMAKILDNPSLALESANLYRVHKLNFYKAIEEINVFFKTNKITFTTEEGSEIYLTN